MTSDKKFEMGAVIVALLAVVIVIWVFTSGLSHECADLCSSAAT